MDSDEELVGRIRAFMAANPGVPLDEACFQLDITKSSLYTAAHRLGIPLRIVPAESETSAESTSLEKAALQVILEQRDAYQREVARLRRELLRAGVDPEMLEDTPGS